MSTDLTLLPRVAHRGQEVTAPRLCALLALLATDLRAGCSVGRIVEGLWPEALPQRPGKAVQVLVSRARAQLGASVVVGTPVGYRLALTEEQVDSSAVLLFAETSAERARGGDHAGALAAADAGLALWEGVPDVVGSGTPGDPVVALRAARAPVRDALVRARGLALARLGRHAEAAGPLATAAARHPRDEEVLAESLRGQAVTASPSAALERYEAYRRELRDELGTDPGPGLRAVQRELLGGGAPVVRRGVLQEPNPLLGRDQDVASVVQLLRDFRAVTVVGTGGLGKTRLAHAVARRAGRRAVYFVPLAGVTADEDVPAAVASALGAGRHAPGRPGGPVVHGPADPVSGVLGVVGPGPALLVLDNCEQVVEGVADLVRALVSSSEDLRVLATSRAPLDLLSESVYALGELGLDTAVELFSQRARAARPGVELPPGAVSDLCRHLDGLPLAVELAAVRVRVLSVAEIARRIGDRFALLRGGPRDVPERHRTLHAVVEWSWNLLGEDARAAMRLLSVFPAGFSGEAAERVWGPDALGVLEQLAGQSLLTVTDTPAGVRFRMLETVREFSAARRAAAGEDETAVAHLLAWAQDFGLAHHESLFAPRLSAERWGRIRAEQDNLVLALRHALVRSDGPTTAAVTALLAALWSTDSNYPRLTALASATAPPLSHYRPDPPYVEAARTAAVLCAAGLSMSSGPRHPGVLRSLVTLRRLPPARPDTAVRALAVVLAAVPETVPPEHHVLRGLCADARPLVAGMAECVATYVWEYEHDVTRAIAAARRTVDALVPGAPQSFQVVAHARLGELCLRTEQGEVAYRHLTAALDVLPRLGDEHDAIGIRRGLALACLQRGEADEAECWLRDADSGAAVTAGVEGGGVPRQDAYYSPGLGERAEVALARGRTEAGLGLWRTAVEQLTSAGPSRGDGERLDPWELEVRSVAVTAHAHAGRPELVTESVGRLERQLRDLLLGPAGTPMDLPVVGTVLHALGMAGLAATTGRRARPVRMIALAERLHVLRQFQPTMSTARAREAARNADAAAYAEAVSAYAALGRAELGEAARALMPDRG
ncbi:ATP-binding protein [Streptomyces silaceus]|uniref:ATP-binding protein n=1 Tax=Streptomyces silaceus TaxID=545123 RepID=UPI0006EBA3C9|nr:BTAD domain-containing putative transcriptional regulator [Streptomyces silaceus]